MIPIRWILLPLLSAVASTLPSKEKVASPASAPPRVIHVFVALADNETQGLVPVPPKIGDGDKPDDNLYWGCDEGIKRHFPRTKDWTVLSKADPPSDTILERLVMRHVSGRAVLVADAYRGSEMRAAVMNFLAAAAGRGTESIPLDEAKDASSVKAGGAASLLAFIGHNGLMDFYLDDPPEGKPEPARSAIVLCCKSWKYFEQPLRLAGAEPLLLTNDLMYPGSFVLKAALDGWLAGEGPPAISERAARAYDKNQNCGIKGARRMFAAPAPPAAKK